MTAARTHLLMEAWLDGAIEDDELVELEAALLESAEMRREFWRRASLHGLIREAVKIAGAPPVDSTRIAGGNDIGPPRRSWFRGGLAAGAAFVLLGGCGIGSVVTSMAFAYVGLRGWDTRAVVIHEEGFEMPPAPRQDYIPLQPDVWSGDETEVVSEQNQIAPRSGGGMLRFVSGHPAGAVYAGEGSEIWRIIDLEEVRAAVGTRDVRVELAAFCNGVDPGFEPLRFWLSVIATDIHPDRLGDRWADQILAARSNPASIAAAQTRDAIDADPSTWERVAASVTVPAKARYLLLHCAAALAEADATLGRHPRHYVDDITVTAEPAEKQPMRTVAKSSTRRSR